MPEGEAGHTGGAPARQPACTATTKRGAACRSFAPPGRPFCVTHDPQRASDVRAARAKGGAAASKLRALRGRRAKLDTMPQLVTFTSGVVHDVVEGELTPDVARAAIYGVALLRSLIELGDLVERVAAIEEQLTKDGEGWKEKRLFAGESTHLKRSPRTYAFAKPVRRSPASSR